MGRYPYEVPMESFRTLDRIRDGAQHGIAQVFTASEILRILDRIDELERIERAVEAFADAADDRTDTYPQHAIDGLYEALAHRRTRPGDARG
jgi:hypothetical protein